jgi:putative ABC transport system permease protein
MYVVLRGATGLLMELTPMRALIVFTLTLFMCVVSGAIAIRKLQAADPANLF